eukprot:11119124-Alexandrium_andersonii.AAC.1
MAVLQPGAASPAPTSKGSRETWARARLMVQLLVGVGRRRAEQQAGLPQSDGERKLRVGASSRRWA